MCWSPRSRPHFNKAAKGGIEDLFRPMSNKSSLISGDAATLIFSSQITWSFINHQLGIVNWWYPCNCVIMIVESNIAHYHRSWLHSWDHLFYIGDGDPQFIVFQRGSRDGFDGQSTSGNWKSYKWYNHLLSMQKHWIVSRQTDSTSSWF